MEHRTAAVDVIEVFTEENPRKVQVSTMVKFYFRKKITRINSY